MPQQNPRHHTPRTFRGAHEELEPQTPAAELEGQQAEAPALRPAPLPPGCLDLPCFSACSVCSPRASSPTANSSPRATSQNVRWVPPSAFGTLKPGGGAVFVSGCVDARMKAAPAAPPEPYTAWQSPPFSFFTLGPLHRPTV